VTQIARHDPRDILGQAPMSRFRWVMVAIMVGLNALDGSDILSIGLASPERNAAA
jgi:hypothetical protein